jgi:16S rRNA U516 pseudouridylate synthase RsuA-like enzyme
LKIKKWIKDDWDILEVKYIKSFDDKKKSFVNVILLEWKKRHIRRMLFNLWYKVLDLQRVREGVFKLGNVKEWNWKHARG